MVPGAGKILPETDMILFIKILPPIAGSTPEQGQKDHCISHAAPKIHPGTRWCQDDFAISWQGRLH